MALEETSWFSIIIMEDVEQRLNHSGTEKENEITVEIVEAFLIIIALQLSRFHSSSESFALL